MENIQKYYPLAIVVIVGLIMILSPIPAYETSQTFYKDRIVGNYAFSGDFDYVENNGDTNRYSVGVSACVEYWMEKRSFPDSVTLRFKRNIFGRKIYVKDVFSPYENKIGNFYNWDRPGVGFPLFPVSLCCK